MLFLITGASGSGKSEYAETVACRIAERDGIAEKIYAAAMENKGAEARERIARHRKMRAGKGFVTAERPFGLSGEEEAFPSGAVVLLECLSNLLANLMFTKGLSGERAEEEILRQVTAGAACCRHMIVVTNEVFSDGSRGGEAVEEYVRALGRVNRRLAALSDVFCEVVYSVPVFLKGEPLCRF